MAVSYCCSYTDPTLNTQQDCENKCNADAKCVAYSWKISYTDCQIYDTAALPDLNEVVAGLSLSPPQGHTDAACYVQTSPPCTGHSFADKASLRTAVTEYDSNAAAATAKYGPIAGWCVSLVTDMQDMFKDLHNFNADISGWDTSGVTSMYRMFWVCSFPRPVPICSAHSRVALSPLHKLRAPRSPASSPVSWHAHSSLRTVHALLATLDSTRRASTSL